MENTIDNKEKFFAQYYGQDIAKPTNKVYAPAIVKINDTMVKWYCLELKPLSQITDEDAIEISMMLVNWQSSMSKLSTIKTRPREDGDHSWDELVMEFSGSHKYIIRYRGGDFLGWINSNGHCEWTLFNHSKVYDYLRLKSYLVPYNGLSTETLIQFGWVRLKE